MYVHIHVLVLDNKQQIEKRCKIDIDTSDHRIRGPVESCVGFERQTLPNAKTNKVVEEEIFTWCYPGRMAIRVCGLSSLIDRLIHRVFSS